MALGVTSRWAQHFQSERPGSYLGSRVALAMVHGHVHTIHVSIGCEIAIMLSVLLRIRSPVVDVQSVAVVVLGTLLL